MARVQGIDVSAYQADIPQQQWNAFKSNGIEFAFIRASAGDWYEDEYFERNLDRAKTAGILCGAYHYFYPEADPVIQAQIFLGMVGDVTGRIDLPLVLDVEKEGAISRERLSSNVQIWLDIVQNGNVFRRLPIVYTRAEYWNRKAYDRFGQYPLWVANYTGVESRRFMVPNGWLQWHFWQYTDKGRLAGFHGNLDRNVFNGSLQDLKDWAEAQKIVTPPPPQPIIHTVQPGERLLDVADKYQISVEAILGANPRLLQDGQELHIPDQPFVVTSDVEFETYTVQEGDTLIRLSVRFGVEVDTISRDNNLANPDLIYVGQVLRIRKA